MEATGEQIRITYGKLRPDGEVSWQFVRHQDHDGVGGLAKLLLADGEAVSELPRAKHLYRVNWVERVIALFRFSWISRVYPGGYFEKQDFQTAAAEQPVFWQRFDAIESAAIRSKAERLGVSTNTLMLCALNQSVTPLLIRRETPRRWMVPSNLRGLIDRKDPLSNHATYILCEIRSGDSPRDVHSAIRDQLRKNVHIGGWDSIRLLGFIGIEKARKFMRLSWKELARKKHTWVGVFSNIGEWKGRSSEGWIFCPPSNRHQPIAAGAVQWNGELRIAVQLHSCLRMEPQKARELLSGWVEELKTATN